MENNAFNKGFSKSDYVQSNLDDAILSCLPSGRDNSILRKELVSKVCNIMQSKIRERTIRYSINALRKNGCPIASTGGLDGGYWLCQNKFELNEYLNHEPLARVKDLLEQINAMKSMRFTWLENKEQERQQLQLL